MKTIKTITSSNVEEIRTEITNALKVLEQYGLTADLGRITYSSGEIKAKLTLQTNETLKIKAALLEPKENGEKDLVVLAQMHNKSFFDNVVGHRLQLRSGEVVTLNGFKNRSPKYPFVGDIKGQTYVLPRSQFTGFKFL